MVAVAKETIELNVKVMIPAGPAGEPDMVSAIFFDLYETLITESETNRSPASSVAEKLGIDKNRFQEEWNARREASLTGVIPDYQILLREICHAAQCPADDILFEQLQRDRLALKCAPFKKIEDKVVQTLEHIRDSGIRIGLISNVRQEEAAGWHPSRLAPLVDDAIFSCEVGPHQA